MKSLFIASLLSTTFAIGITGCDTVDRKFDCTQICERYSDCFDKDHDTAACVDRCETNADNSDDFDKKADDCENCLDDRSCSGSFACADECIGIVP